ANGSDESLRLLCTAFLEPGEAIAMLSPTYSIYETLAQIADATFVEYPVSAADDYAFPNGAIEEKQSKIFFLANPNPPLGTLYGRETLRALCEARPDRLVVLDEAYVDFSRENHLSLVRDFPNLAVTRTYSKAYSLAGARVGYVVAQPDLIERLNAIKDSYNVNALSQSAAIGALEDQDYYNQKIADLIATRDILRGELRTLGFEVPESQGNFLFARCGDGAKMYEMLKKEKILVRYFRRANLKDGVRITIGTKQQVATLLETLKNLVEKVPALRQV
ncbi:MAG: histidinol-phosphate transaminase, partial [bacterium]